MLVASVRLSRSHVSCSGVVGVAARPEHAVGDGVQAIAVLAEALGQKVSRPSVTSLRAGVIADDPTNAADVTAAEQEMDP